VSEELRRFVRPREGWLSLGLLFVMLLALGWSIQTAAWLEHLDFLVPVAFYAVIVGAVLALLPLSVVLTLPLGALAGCAVTLWTVGGEYLTALGQVDRVLALHDDAIGFVQSLMQQAYPTQLSPYAIGLGVLMWSVAFIAAYTVYRHHRVLDAILLVGVALIVNMSATFTDLLGFLVLFVLAALLLWLRGALLAREDGWQLRRINETVEVPTSIMRSGMIFITASIVLAWVLTSVAVAAPLTGAWRNLDGVWNGVRNNLDGVFGQLTNPESRFSGTTFGSQFRVSGTWVSNDAEVMTVGSQHGYYMRAVTYDEYTGHGWERTDGTSRSVGAGELIFPGDTPERPSVTDAFELATVTVTVQGQVGRNVFTPGSPTTALIPVSVYQTAGQQVLGGLEAPNGVGQGEGYQITAAISNATQAQLAKAGTDYPDVIRQLYLSTTGVTDRTRQLARQVVDAAHASDPFHQAQALAEFLRSGPDFTYATQVTPPDPGRDLVDSFLFSTRAGYCEYFASAMAVMARSIGLPARLAVGFAPGERLAQGIYQYRERNAHAWAEIYFPGYGWQIFEATKSIPPLTRVTGSSDTPDDVTAGPQGNPGNAFLPGDPGVISALPSFRPAPGGIAPGETPGQGQEDARSGNAIVIIVIVIAALIAIGWRMRRTRRRWRFMTPGDRQWQRLTLAVDRAGVAQQPSETIYEYAHWLEGQLPQRRPDIRTIADAKVWEAYSGRSMSETMIERIERAWQKLRMPLLWLAARTRIRSLMRPPRRQGH
jgi:transglutaminase-like putative cysteine protease